MNRPLTPPRPASNWTTHRRALLAAGSAGLAYALLASAPLASAAPTYSLLTVVPIPASAANTSGKFTGYDLSVVDPETGLFYLTDRSNNGIDVFSTRTNQFIGRIGQGLFAGTAGGNNDIAGPNGLAIARAPGGKLLLAGNTGTGNAGNVIAFNLQPDGLTVIGAPRVLSATVAGVTPTPSNRVDGVAYAPTTNTILAANNASNPGYLTLFNNASGATIKTLILDGRGGTPNVAGNGVEAVIFNTVTQTFFVAVPNLTSDASGNGLGFGGVIEIDPASGNLLRTFDFQALGSGGASNPTGLVQGAGAAMLAASGTAGGPTVLLDPQANGGRGALSASTAVTGGDQAAYDPFRDTFFEAARFDPAGPSLGIFNGDGSFSQKLPITNNDHSVAVDPVTGRVYVAYGASADTAAIPNAANGGVAIFAPAATGPVVVSVLGAGATRGGFVLSRTGDVSQAVTVFYHNGGSANRGVDYVALSGSATILAGQSEVVIPVTLLPGANRNKKVKVILDSGSGYAIAKTQSKVFLSELP